MKLLIIGATGGTGKELVLQAFKHGHDVTALVRNPKKVTVNHERLTIIGGDVLDYSRCLVLNVTVSPH